ncbi:MAG: protein kinase [Planctomycetes bacterium]|nr:protein kinase [Planctomycetota bacterium]
MSSTTCTRCRTPVPSGSKFCPECATPVPAFSPAPGPPPDPAVAAPAPAVAPAGSAPETVIDGKYRVLASLGEGGFGSVYRVEDLLLRREFALKTLHAQHGSDTRMRERFLREARVLLDLAHPNLVAVRHAGEWRGQLYLVEDLCPGEPLAAVLKREGRLPGRAVLRLAGAILRGLEHAHAKGVVHRDLKPANVLVEAALGGGWNVKIVDFGVAKVLEPEGDPDGKGDTFSLTGTGAMIGTPSYMSPEQSQGKKLDARADLYALGVILYELVVGRRPFRADTLMELVIKVAQEPPPRFETVGAADDPRGLEALVLRALAKDPKDRPPSARHMLNEVKALLEAPQPGRRPTTFPGLSESGAPSGRTASGTASAASVASAGVARPQVTAPITPLPTAGRWSIPSWGGRAAAAGVALLALGTGAWWLLRGSGPAAAASPPAVASSNPETPPARMSPDLAVLRSEFDTVKRAAETALPKGELVAGEHPFEAAVRIARDFADRRRDGAIASEAAAFVTELERREAEAVKAGHDEALTEAREKLALGERAGAATQLRRASAFVPKSEAAAAVELELKAADAKAGFADVKGRALAVVPADPSPGEHPYGAAIDMVRAFAEGPNAGASAAEAREFVHRLETQEAEAVKAAHDKAVTDARERLLARDWAGAAASVRRAFGFLTASTEAVALDAQLKLGRAKESFESAKAKARELLPSGELQPGEHPYGAAIDFARSFAEGAEAEPIRQEAADFVASLQKQATNAVQAAHDKAITDARLAMEKGDLDAAEQAVARAAGFWPASTQVGELRASVPKAREVARGGKEAGKAPSGTPSSPAAPQGKGNESRADGEFAWSPYARFGPGSMTKTRHKMTAPSGTSPYVIESRWVSRDRGRVTLKSEYREEGRPPSTSEYVDDASTYKTLGREVLSIAGLQVPFTARTGTNVVEGLKVILKFWTMEPSGISFVRESDMPSGSDHHRRLFTPTSIRFDERLTVAGRRLSCVLVEGDDKGTAQSHNRYWYSAEVPGFEVRSEILDNVSTRWESELLEFVAKP